MIEANQENFMQVVVEESKKRPVLVDFWAEWCGPCKALGPVLEKLEKDYESRFLLVKVNTEKEQLLAQRFQIQSIPAVKLLIDGKIANEFVGALPEEEIVRFLQPYVADDGLLELDAILESGDWQQAYSKIKEQNLEGEELSKRLWEIAIHSLAESNFDKEKSVSILKEVQGSKFQMQKSSLIAFLEANNDQESINTFLKMFAENQQEEVLQNYLNQIESSESDEEKEQLKQHFLACLSVLGAAHPLALAYRKKLSFILF